MLLLLYHSLRECGQRMVGRFGGKRGWIRGNWVGEKNYFKRLGRGANDGVGLERILGLGWQGKMGSNSDFGEGGRWDAGEWILWLQVRGW